MASSARSRPSTTATRQTRGPTLLPPYQPPQHPLNESAQRALQNLPRDHRLDSLKSRLKAANNHLTFTAADLNDRLQMKTAIYEKQRKRLEAQGSQGSDHEDARISEARQQADELTDKLDEGIRMVIDSSAEVENVERALRELQENVNEGRGRIVPTQSTLGASQFRTKSVRTRQGDDSDDEESDGGDESTQPIGENDSAVRVLQRRIADRNSAYHALSMSSRYAQHNDYVGFKKIVHDAHYPTDQAPPMPNASTWFSSGSPDPSNPGARSTAGAGNDAIEDEDEDLAVASERVSIKCPITLLPMKDPVTSQKCPHSFEKEAILSMINASDVRTGGSGRRGDGQKAMRCPVCEVLLTASDVKENPVLVRKIKRIQDALAAQNEAFSEDEDDDRPARPSRFGANQRPEEIGSSPAASKTPRSRFKSERRSQAPTRMSRQVSMVPNTQLEGLADEEQGGLDSSAITDAVDLEDGDESE